jgi:hypothetical protein
MKFKDIINESKLHSHKIELYSYNSVYDDPSTKGFNFEKNWLNGNEENSIAYLNWDKSGKSFEVEWKNKVIYSGNKYDRNIIHQQLENYFHKYKIGKLKSTMYKLWTAWSIA